MVFSVQQVKYEVLAYIKEFGGDFSDYYVGLTDNPGDALFVQHNVDREIDPWLYKQLLTYQAGRTVLDYFLNRLATDGAVPANPTEDFDCIYVYKKSERTHP